MPPRSFNGDTAGETFDAATGEEIIGGADGPTAVITAGGY